MGKTVTTYLIDSDPQGAQYVFISNKICQMFVIPRSNLKILNERPDLQTPAFYILLGGGEASKPKAYIGETENFKERVKDHDYKKDFWQKALIFISKDSAMTKADVQYLEYCAIHLAKEVDNFLLEENKQFPKQPNLPEYQKDNMDEFFEDIRFLTSFVGCRIFDSPREVPRSEVFHLESSKRQTFAQGIYDASGLTVLKGSRLSPSTTTSFNWARKRQELLNSYASFRDGAYVLHTSVSFSSPSTAASFCLGRSCNGWSEWKTEDKRTLDSIHRIS